MLTELQISELEKTIGYVFKDKLLLDRAFCHSSYANEHSTKSNERLEFLGDSVLNFVITKELFFKTENTEQDEGQLTVARAETVSKKPLAELTKRLKLMQYLQLGEGAKNEKKISVKFFSNVSEAVIGAIFLDCESGLKNANDFILNNLPISVAEKRVDYKTELQEILQKRHEVWSYNTLASENGFTSNLNFYAGEFVGEGLSKKEAEQSAASKGLKAALKK